MPLSVLTLRRLRAGLGVLVVAALLVAAAAARAEGEDSAAIEKITNLNKKALDAYNNLDFEDARKLLKQALELSSSSGLDKHPIKARTHIHMGVVLITTKQQDLGIKQFRKALEIQPDIQVTRALANPEIMQAFEEASAGVGAPEGGDNGGGDGPSGGVTNNERGSATTAPRMDISLVPVTRARRGKPVAISVAVSAQLTGYSKMVLAYKAQGTAEFVGVDMRRAGNTFVGEIPASATHGNLLQYYVEAETDDDTAVATNGTEEKPYVIALTSGADGNDGDLVVLPGDGDDDDHGGAPKYFLGLAAGSGTGYATGSGELNVDSKVKGGFAPSSAAQIVPEIGYFIMPRFRLSFQARIQIVTGRTPLNLNEVVKIKPDTNVESCGADHICSTGSPLAVAIFARGTWFFGSGRLQPYFSFALGGGVIRHVVKFTSLRMICGEKGDQVCFDSVRAGPIFAGPGGGVLFNLTPIFGLIAEVNSVLGFPNFTFHLDLNLGVAAHF